MVTGATGYVGGRLVPRLLEDGFRVRVYTRSPDKLRDVEWYPDVEVVRGSLPATTELDEAMRGVFVAYYLVHSMTARGDFGGEELRAAVSFARAAESASVSRIVYLGGLHPEHRPLSRHLASRAAVGQVFLESAVPAAVLQAGTIIGSGSASFEIIRHLTEVLPYMPAPKWVRNFVQPIAIRDVLHYLSKAADLPPDVNREFDIGGPDVLRYGQLMNGYAVQAGLPQRPIAALPVLTPWLASQWINLVTPVPRDLAVPIVESLQHSCVVRNHDVDGFIAPPPGGLLSYRESVRLALARIDASEVPTTWRGASLANAPSDPLPSDPSWAGRTVLSDERERESTASPTDLWLVLQSIGGPNGWYSLPWAWSLRGMIDKLFGGVGLARGRRDPSRLRQGDVIDFWRVESLEPPHRIVLRAEMRVPGDAWLELTARPGAGGGSVYRQRAVFLPRGLSGRLYWMTLVPMHALIFGGMARRIVRAAEHERVSASLAASASDAES
ncbi:SDR family oxidoreductase [Ruicaihuangia caeni]|uniref:SDR family oxidoreductase n=1 Tax=Ruicaihuangia caeni TaxID=3042517 RepID=A0AAW6TA55_9MICO|nr:SDR family oxidoreductase [Klugiella sp. YN-L-19]MDI2098858.1 SDR family oxidoreductase [Klugiella sp. YN-L-19]